jgi:hypothetical protein
MKKLFAAASGIFGCIPGISVMWTELGTPPGYGKIFGGVIQAFGALAILLLFANKEKLRRLNSRKVTLVAIVLASASLVFLILYIQLLTLSVVSHPIHGTVYYPLWNSGHAQEMIDRAGGRYAAVDHYGSYPVSKAVHEAPSYALASVATTILLLLVYQGIFTTLTLAFGVMGLREDAAQLEAGAATGTEETNSVAPQSLKKAAGQ